MSDEALQKLAALWRQEQAAVRARLAEERQGVPLRARVAQGLALTDLEIDETDALPGGRLVAWLRSRHPSGLGSARIGPGDPVRLWWDDPDGPDAVRATVGRRAGDRLSVVIDAELPERFDDPGFRLDRDAPETTFQRGQRALAAFRGARRSEDTGRLREVFYGARAPESERQRPHAPLDPHLNGPQQEAVARALAALDVALIHGPPGTGKTRTLVEIIRQAVARGERVLATAASNTAVDNLAARLVDAGLPILRLGHPARVSDTILPRTLDALLEATDAWRLTRQWMADARDLRRRIRARSDRGTLRYGDRRALAAEAGRLMRDVRKHLQAAESGILDGASVICATAAGADAYVLRSRRFDLVVLDEATQSPDPMSLVALARAGRVVMAGDPCQLPPTVIDGDAARQGLAHTLFERVAAAHPASVSLLTVQHRMHQALMAWPSRVMYEGRLLAHPDVAGHQLDALPGVTDDPLRPGPLVFVDTAGKGFDEVRGERDPSTSNPGQADRTAREVRRLLSRGLQPTDLALITPYSAQARLLESLLAPEVARGLEVGTVDGFQGREKEAVVVDLVRSNEAGGLGFLQDTRRMNVALTRARRLLIVIGDSATLGRHPWYAAFLEHAETTGAWLSAWSDEAAEL